MTGLPGIANVHGAAQIAALLPDPAFRALRLGTWLSLPNAVTLAGRIAALRPLLLPLDARLLADALAIAAADSRKMPGPNWPRDSWAAPRSLSPSGQANCVDGAFPCGRSSARLVLPFSGPGTVGHLYPQSRATSEHVHERR
jgi:hypothetical protein